MMVKTVERLKKMYRDLTDKELLEERDYRRSYSTRMVGAEGTELIMNIRKAIAELIAERGLERKGA